MDEEELRYLLPLKEYVGFCDSLKYVRGERGRGGQGVIDVSCMRRGESGQKKSFRRRFCILLCEFGAFLCDPICDHSNMVIIDQTVCCG